MVGKHGGVRGLIRPLLQDNPKKLWTWPLLAQETGLENRQAQNVLYQMWAAGQIYRHKTNTDDNKGQFALDIPEKDRMIREKVISSKKSIKKRKLKKSEPLTIKEFTGLMEQIINMLMMVEERVTAELAETYEMKKAYEKMQNVMDRF